MRTSVRWVVVAGTVVTLAVPATAQDVTRDLKVHPAPGSDTDPRGDYYVLNAPPGRTIREEIVLENGAGSPLEVTIVPIDAFTDRFGDVAYRTADRPAKDVGGWISVTQARVRVPSGGSRRVGFSIEVPSDARPGVNLGALSVQGAKGSGNGRVIVAVQINTPGERMPEMVVSGITVARSENSYFLDVGMTNRGTEYATGNGVLRLPEDGFESPIELDAFVPGTSIDYRIEWPGGAEEEEGEHPVEVRIEYGEGRAVSWTGTFTIGDQAPGRRSQPGASGSGSLPLILGLAAAVAGAFYLGLWRARGASVPRVEEPMRRSFTPRREQPEGSAEQDVTPAQESSEGTVKAPDEVDPLSETGATREAVDQDDAPAGARAPKKTTRKRTAKKTTTKKTTTAGHNASSKKSGAAGRGAPGVRKKPAAEVPEEGDETEKEREEE